VPFFALAASLTATAQSWPGFRGPGASGIADGQATPTEWSVPESKNIRWRTAIPGLAHSSPVIHGGKVFVTTAERKAGAAELTSLYGSPNYGSGDPVEDEGEHAFRVLCLDRKSGAILWERDAYVGVPKVKRHPKSTHANSTPACDAGHVVAFFGSEGLYCYDHDGKLLWKKDLGVLDAGAPGMPQDQWGFGSSRVIHAGRVLVQCDVQGQSFLAMLELADGKEVWRIDRDEDPTWCTPTVLVEPERSQVIANGYKHIGGYDLATGKELWKLVGGGDVPVPTPVAADGLIYITSAHGRMRPIYAVKSGATGLLDIDPAKCAHMAWSYDRKGVYMQTPLAYGGLLYCCSDGGALACYDARTGNELYAERLGDGTTGFSGSPVAADGKLYFSGEDGLVHVVKAGREFALLATNDLGETHLATPAIADGALYFRTRGHLVAVGSVD